MSSLISNATDPDRMPSDGEDKMREEKDTKKRQSYQKEKKH